MGLKLITSPTTEPLTLAEAKLHLRVVSSDDDTLITALIKAARSHAENWTGRAFIDQTWELVLDEFPVADNSSQTTTFAGDPYAILIPKPPLIEVVEIAYIDSGGDEQIIASTEYYVDSVSEPGWVVPNTSWPTTIVAINSVRIRFRAGYVSANSPSDPAVPEDISAAVKLLLGSFYEHREQQVVGSIVSKLSFGVENLLRPHRVLLGMS